MSVATSRTLNYQIDTTDQSVIQIFKSKLLHSQIRMHLKRNYNKHVSILTHLKGKCFQLLYVQYSKVGKCIKSSEKYPIDLKN